jgi:sugar phosphate permease
LHPLWRGALLVASAPGLVLSLAVAVTLSEPARAWADTEAEPLVAVLRFMVRDQRLFVTVAPHILASMVLIGIGSWVPVLMTRSHGLPSAAAGVYSALAVGVPGCVGLVLGSAPSGLYAAGREDRLLLLTSAAVDCFGAASLAGGVFLGPVFGICLGWAPPRSRGTVMAIIVVAANLVGAGLGPQFVGSVSDLLARLGDPRKLDHALASLVLFGSVPAWLFKSVYDRVARTA